MEATPIPDDEIWEGSIRKVISPPGGDLLNDKVRACEALLDVVDGGPRFNMRIELTAEDVERIEHGDRVFWLHWWGDHLHPFAFFWPERTYLNAPDPYPDELTPEQVAALPECPGWMFKHSSLEVPLTEAELEASRATDGVDARRGYWKRGPWCECGRAFGQHTDAELKK